MPLQTSTVMLTLVHLELVVFPFFFFFFNLIALPSYFGREKRCILKDAVFHLSSHLSCSASCKFVSWKEDRLCVVFAVLEQSVMISAIKICTDVYTSKLTVQYHQINWMTLHTCLRHYKSLNIFLVYLVSFFFQIKLSKFYIYLPSFSSFPLFHHYLLSLYSLLTSYPCFINPSFHGKTSTVLTPVFNFHEVSMSSFNRIPYDLNVALFR